jgi:hypothetical protein
VTYRPACADETHRAPGANDPRVAARCTIAIHALKPVEIAAQVVCVVTMRRFLAVLSACLWACGDNHSAPLDGGDEGPFQIAPHAPLPIVAPHTGTVLSTVHLVTLKYTDYAPAFDLDMFGSMLVTSRWYAQIGTEYGIATGTAEVVDIGTAPSSLTRRDLDDAIVGLVDSGRVPRPAAADNQVLFLVYVPRTVIRGTGLTGRSYHEMLTLPTGERVPVAVVLESPSSTAASTTMMAAHQVINAVTNPYRPPTSGYYADPPETDPWSLVRGEIGDLCEGEDPVTEGGFAYPRAYSNDAAMRSKPPCLPGQAGDVWSDVTAEPSQVQMLSPGGSVKFRLTGWSTSQVPDWQIRLQVADSSQLSLDEMTPQLSSTSINNNTTVTLTLHAPREAMQQTKGGVYILSGKNGRPWAVGFVVE